MSGSARLPPSVYAEDAPMGALVTAELVLVISTRLYVLPRAAAGLGADWRDGLQAGGLDGQGLCAFDAFFTIVGHGQSRPLDIRCPCRRSLGSDEARLLQLISLFQRDRPEPAAAILGDWLAPTATRLAQTQAKALASALKLAGLIIPLRHACAATASWADHAPGRLARLH